MFHRIIASASRRGYFFERPRVSGGLSIATQLKSRLVIKLDGCVGFLVLTVALPPAVHAPSRGAATDASP
jgi:hypothetical protein